MRAFRLVRDWAAYCPQGNGHSLLGATLRLILASNNPGWLILRLLDDFYNQLGRATVLLYNCRAYKVREKMLEYSGA